MEDANTLARDIFEGNWPSIELSADQKVSLINRMGYELKELNGDKLQDSANNAIIWLGGESQDLRCYGVQLFLRYFDLKFQLSDQANQRVDSVRSKVWLDGYLPSDRVCYYSNTWEDVTKYRWPRHFVQPWEERIEALADDVAAEDTDDVPPVDLILSGRERPYDLDADNIQRLIIDCLNEIKAFLDKYQGKPNILYYEKLNHFYAWLLDMPVIELGIMGMRASLALYKLPASDKTYLPALADISEKFRPFIVS